jgi:hypothetical protein
MTTQIAIHEIRLGKPKKNGEVDIVRPGKVFDCPDADLAFLQSAGACRDLTEAEAERMTAPKRAAKPAAKPADDPAEAERLALIEKAKGMGLKGIRKDMTTEVLNEKIAEAEAASSQGGDDDEDVVG